MKRDLQECLRRLVNGILTIINEGLQEHSLSPEFYPCVRWKVEEFEYSDAGITKFSSRGERFPKPRWHDAALAVKNKVRKSTVYREALKSICKLYDLEKKRANGILETLVVVVASGVLTTEVRDPSHLDDYVVRFMKDLNEENQEYSAIVSLHGIIMQPEVLELDENTLLKKTTVSDLEREVMLERTHMQHFSTPTAIMHIRVLARGPRKLQEEIGRAIAILKLFKVGAVRSIQYKMSSKSITSMARGTITSGRGQGAEQYLLTEKEVGSLKIFWSRLKNIVLPDSVYRSPKKANNLSIAYQRYVDALDVGVLEKRMASAIMGLEALYLLPTERQELRYRLGLRVAKLLSFSGYDSPEVYRNLYDAYDIRNAYVHGGLLSQKKKIKLEKRYGDLAQLLKQILDYLRASIVVSITSRPNKESLIKHIDDTFINSAGNEELRKIIARA